MFKRDKQLKLYVTMRLESVKSLCPIFGKHAGINLPPILKTLNFVNIFILIITCLILEVKISDNCTYYELESVPLRRNNILYCLQQRTLSISKSD